MEEREVVVIGGGPAGLSAAIFTQFDGWTVVTADGSLSAHFEKTIAITDGGAEVLTPWDN